MRVSLRQRDNPELKDDDEWFHDFVLQVGNGVYRGHDFEDLPADIIALPPCVVSKSETIMDFVDEIYPDLHLHSDDSDWLCERAILAPLLEAVNSLNDQILDRFPGNDRTYYSSDAVGDDENQRGEFTTEYLNSLECSGLPLHKLRLKVGCPAIIMRNINPKIGACNGTRVKITELRDHIIVASILTGEHKGEIIHIPRITLSPSDTDWPFTLRRRQFPLQLCFVMTFHRAQGQTFLKLGLYLPEPVFVHGQLYVGVSRVGASEDLSIYIVSRPELFHGKLENHGEATFTRNIVWQELLLNN